MDAKITLSFNKEVIERAKVYAEQNNISLSRLMELVLDKITSKPYPSIENYPIAQWVQEVAEPTIEYKKSTPKKSLKSEFRNRKK